MPSEAPEPYAALVHVVRNLGIIVRENRRRKGLSSRAAAREIGCAFTTVRRIENGELPNGQTLLEVLAWLGHEAP